MAKIRVDKTGESPAVGPDVDVKPAKLEIDAGEFPTLQATLKALAPEIFESGAKKDGYRKDAPPTLFSGEDETTASSVRPRPMSGRTPPHRLRAELSQQEERGPTSQTAVDPEDLDALEYEASHEVDETPDDDELDDKLEQASQDYMFDLVADQYKDNMEAMLRDVQGRQHARGEDLWHERYRYDAHMNQDSAEDAERERNKAADRASTEAAEAIRRASDEANARADAERRLAADDYARRLAEDRNRR